MQSKLVGGWLLSTSFGVLGLITLGGYTRLKRAGLSMVDWKPLSIKYPNTDADWEIEYQRYKQFPEYEQNKIDLQDFKDIYYIEYLHRLVARGMGLYLVVPMAVFWRAGYLTTQLRSKLMLITAMFGVQGLLGWIMVSSGLQKKDYDGRVKVAPLNLAIHLICGVGLYATIFSTALSTLKKSPQEVMNTAERYLAGAKLRSRYMGLLHLTLTTVFSGALVAGSDAGKMMTNWPFYGDSYFFPEDAMSKEPFYLNFTENKSTIQFVHRNLGYLTFAAAIELWRFSRRVNPVFSMTANASLILTLSTFQVLLGITALLRGTPFYESLAHQTNGLLFMTTILYGLSAVRKPNKAFIEKLLGK